MKKGITSTIAFELEIQVSDVEQVVFTFKEKIDSEEYLLQKEYPSESVIFEDNKFKCKLTQEETDSLSNTFFVEAQINLSNKSVIKSDICKKIMPPTLWTTFVEDNESSGEEEIISLTFTDYVEGGGSGGTTNYNELENRPKANNKTIEGNHNGAYYGLQDLLTPNGHIAITNNVITTEANKVYRAVMDGDNISTDLSDYPNIQMGDIAIYFSDKIRVWAQPTAPTNVVYWTEIEYSNQKITESENAPASSGYTTQYTVGDIWLQKIVENNTTSYKVFILVDIAEMTPPQTFTWVDLTSGTEYTGGNGIKIENDEISVDLAQNSNLGFISGKLYVDQTELAMQTWFREKLADTSVSNALASKTYVDNLMSGATKWEFVNELPTEDIDIHTIYFVPKESAETDNIYNEWVYALKSRNPDVYDWELLGTSQVDLTNYYTKTESDNKYQPIIDSTHKVSADNIDDSTSTNKFVHKSNASDNLISIRNDGLQVSGSSIANDSYFLSVAPFNSTLRSGLLTPDGTNDFQPLLTVGNGIDITSDTISVNKGDYLAFDNNHKLTVSTYALGRDTYFRNQLVDSSVSNPLQAKITSSAKLDADLVTDTSSTNKFVPSHSSSDATKVLSVDSQGGLVWATSGSGGSYIAGDGIDITNNTISVDIVSSGNCLDFNSSGELRVLGSTVASDTSFKSAMPYDSTIRQALLTTYGDYNFQPKLTAGTNITITNDTISATDTTYTAGSGLTLSSGAFSVDNPVPAGTSSDYGKYLKNNNGTLEWASVSGGGSYSGGDGIDITNDTISVDLKSGTELQITSGELDIDLSNYATTSSVSGKADKTTITTDTSSTTDTLDLLNNTEQRYTQELSSLTLSLPLSIDDDFISSVVFKSGTTATQMTYDSSIKWSGDDVTSNAFVPTTSKTYNIVLWYDGINVNGVVRGV